MKQPVLSKSILFAAGISFFAMTSFAQTQNSKEQEFRMTVDKKFAQQNRGSDAGMNIRAIEFTKVREATSNINGRFTLEFSKTDKVTFAQKGGVIIGSPSDGLDDLPALSNQSLGGDVTLNPPLDPDQSITVVGGSGYFCIYKIYTNDTGEAVKSGSAYSQENCQELGKPISLLHPGFYLIAKSLMDPRGTHSSLAVNKFSQISLYFTAIEPGEQKVIPLRKINIPKPTGKLVQHSLQADLNSQIEKEKIASVLWTSAFNEKDKPNSIEEYASNLKTKLDAMFNQWLSLEPKYSVTKTIDANYSSLTLNKDEYTYYVFPGVYFASWVVDGQNRKPTTGIHVQ